MSPLSKVENAGSRSQAGNVSEVGDKIGHDGDRDKLERVNFSSEESSCYSALASQCHKEVKIQYCHIFQFSRKAENSNSM